MRPFLRWVGGKARVAKYLGSRIPHFTGRYCEPFMGAGAVFWRLQPRMSILGDANPDLIRCYLTVRDHAEELAEEVEALSRDCSLEAYYLRRNIFNEGGEGVKRSALFIYLNRLSFNGVWRVNRQGQFNVPFGNLSSPTFPSAIQLSEYSARLQDADIECRDFAASLQDLTAGDFAYLDPPYLPASDTAFFRHYTAKRFCSNDHERLAAMVSTLTARGVRVLLTIAADEHSLAAYKGLVCMTHEVTRFVGAGGGRRRAKELLVQNWS